MNGDAMAMKIRWQSQQSSVRKMQVSNQCLEMQWAAQSISSTSNEGQSSKSPCNAFSLWF